VRDDVSRRALWTRRGESGRCSCRRPWCDDPHHRRPCATAAAIAPGPQATAPLPRCL